MRAAIYVRGVAVVLCAMAGATAALAADDAPFSWTGFYVGAHAGAGMDYSDFSNPYGPTLFGDEVRSPGPFIGGQFGYNYQDGQFVYGVQADVTWANLAGTATCMQPAHAIPALGATFVGGAFGATCQVNPDFFGTVTARGGLALGPQGRTLVYGKGGLAWIHNQDEMGLNNILTGAGPTNALSSSNGVQVGFTLGAGLEYAMNRRWSLGFEYDYLNFGGDSVATPASGPIGSPGVTGIAGSVTLDGRPASMSQDIHAVKLAVNYALEDRGDPGLPVAGPPSVASGFGRGLQTEIGGRYVYAWSRYQQDLGKHYVPLPDNASRLTWKDVGTGGVELFGRVDTPWNFMLKGIVGVGRGNTGAIYDEDWGLANPAGTEVTPYQVTKSDISSSLDYFTLDGGYDLVRTDTYRIAPFVGYNYFHYKMNALGSSYLNFSPPQPSGDPSTTVFLQEMDEWRSLRLGTAAELMLTPALKLTGDVAYLPYVSYSGVDNHPLRSDAGGVTRSPQNGVGTGVQVEAILAYDITDQFSIGAGGRYWSMAVPQGLTNFFSKNEFTKERFSTENAAVFAQGSYKFNAPD